MEHISEVRHHRIVHTPPPTLHLLNCLNVSSQFIEAWDRSSEIQMPEEKELQLYRSPWTLQTHSVSPHLIKYVTGHIFR